MIEIQEDDVVVGESYFVVCDDGVLRYLIAEEHKYHNTFTEYVYYSVGGVEKYRTCYPDKIFKI